MQSAIEALRKKIELEERHIGNMEQLIGETKERMAADAEELELAKGRVQVYLAAIAKLETKSVDVKIVPAETDPFGGNLADIINPRYVDKAVHERALAELEHAKSAHTNCQEYVVQLKARIDKDQALLLEKDHRIVAQEQRLRELETNLASSITMDSLPARLGHEMPVEDPAAQWFVAAVQAGRQCFDNGVSPDDFYNAQTKTVGSFLAGLGYDSRRLATMLIAKDREPARIEPSMPSDHAEAAWIFQTLDQGYQQGYEKAKKPAQHPSVASKLWHFGYRAGKAKRKAEKRGNKDD